MKILLSLVLFVTSAMVAHGEEARVVAESDTGIVFGNLNCKAIDHKIVSTRIAKDVFDYLEASVAIDIECVGRRGLHWIIEGADRVIFPTLTFDWETQSWLIGDTTIATLENHQVVVNDELDMEVWSNREETHVSFKVQFKTKPENN
jgi:hypothetical protein